MTAKMTAKMTGAKRFVVIIFVIVVSALLAGGGSRAAHAASPAPPFPLAVPQSDGIAIETMTVEYAFGQQMVFRLVVRGDAAITSATVFFRADDRPTQNGAAALTEAGAGVQATFTHDLPGGGLPPFCTITYWWEISDATGRTSTTPSQSVDYVDNRFTWQSVEEGSTRVYWYDGDQAFGQLALDTARKTLPQLNENLAAPLPQRIDVYIYSTVEELQSALLMAGRAWQSGQARPDLGVVLIAASPGPDALLQLRRELGHELTHLLVYQAAGSGYSNVPRWLDEGLAMLGEGTPDAIYQTTLDGAYRKNALLPLESLCAPFPSDAQVALLAYAESQSVTQFIREQYGVESTRALIAAYRDGASCASGVERALGVSLGSLELSWRARLGPQGAWQAVFSSIGAWLVLAALLLLAPLPLVLGKVKSGK